MTKIREGYKETELGVIPEDWDVIDMNKLIWFQEGPGLRKWQWKTTGMKVINVTNLTSKYLDLSLTNKFIDIDEANSKYPHFQIDVDDIVVASSGNSWGKVSVVREIDLPLLMNTSVIRFKGKEGVNQQYLYQFLLSGLFKNQIKSLITGSAQPNFGPFHLNKTLFIKPPLPEQQRIAEILSTTDAHIEKLDKIIEDYQLLKKGMMKKLLTEGIGHTEFKETEIGRIPKEWEVVKLSQVADAEKINSFIDGDWIEKEHITDAGIRLIQTGNIGVGYYIEKEEKKFIFERSFNDLNCKEVYPNDILICRMAEPTGRSCIIPNLNSRMITSVDCVILRVNESYYDNHFVNHYINSEESLKYSYQNQQGTTRKRITRKKLGELKIPVPKLEEQLKISSILNEIDQRIELLRTEVKDFKNFKKSMMEQLLTGKIRTIYLQSGGVI